MTNLGSHYHDFPHLAKQSGFCFQLHKGKVNWLEIENLNLNDIVTNRNFQLLEKNLANVINCNLEKDYDLKNIDENFVKLFKLSQLGVDYLSYCEAYLDKCVVILQEQLIAFQEECESLKHGKEKREGEEIKRKNKTESYQCEKCDKQFISEFYLNFHNKRRHNSPSTPKRFYESPKSFADSAQQTEREEKSTTSTQTALLHTDRATTTQDDEDMENLKTQDTVKMEYLEREILHLKERLKKAENAFMEKSETSAGFPLHNTMLWLLPSCRSGYDEVKPFPLSPPEKQQNNSEINVTIDQKMKKLSSEVNTELEKITNDKENESPNNSKEGRADYKKEVKQHLGKGEMECEKENINPNKGSITMLSKPLPPPRKAKKVIPARASRENMESVGLSADPATNTSIKRKTGSDVCESPSGLIKDQSISNESLDSRKSAFLDYSSTSFFKTIVRKNSPRFRTLGQNFKRSLTNLCDSVSSTGKDLIKKKSMDENSKLAVISKLNDRLRQMGVDGKWGGIPRKIMKQKLKALKHRRKLLIKENPMYPFIRENIEEAILEKVKKNQGRKDGSTKESGKEVSDEQPTAQPNTESEVIKPQRCVMYDIESDSESKSSESEIEFIEQNIPPQTEDVEKEFDLSVFQVERGNFREKDITARVEELLTDSDIDGDISYERHFNALLRESGERSDGRNKGVDGFHSTLELNAKKKVCFVSDDSEEGLSETKDEDVCSLKSDWENFP